MSSWGRRQYGRLVSVVPGVTRRRVPPTHRHDAGNPEGWGELTTEDLRRQGIGPGMSPPGEQGPRAVAMPRDDSR
jgi:hypothetical protein